MKEDMRGCLVLLRGKYRRGLYPRFFNEESGDYNYIGGYDPENEDNEEWYMLYDRETLMCMGGSSNFDTIIDVVFKTITKYPTRERFMNMVRSLDTPHHISGCHRRLMEEIIDEYGYYYEDVVEEQEDFAYKRIADNSPLKKARKQVKRVVNLVEVKERKAPAIIDTGVKHQKKGVKPLKRKLIRLV